MFMEYKLCKDNLICCDNDCRRCANLVHGSLTNENKSLKMRLDTLTEKCDRQVEAHNKLYDAYWRVKGERDKIHRELKELIDKCQELEKENAKLDKECEKLHSDNQRFAGECRYYIERESGHVIENGKLRTMNSELLYRNGQLMNSYGELNDKIESLKEDIIRLDKCLSNRQCVKEERYGE